MDGTDLATLVKTGQLLHMAKLSLTGVNSMWIFDYFLTLGDEVKYAWSGRKSWVFVLFLANRYAPVWYLTWFAVAVFGYTHCDKTEWVPVLYSVTIAALSQITFALRIYGVTGRNKWLGGSLSVLIFARYCFGIYLVIRFGTAPPQPLPEVNLYMFQFCVYERWRAGELVFTNFAVAFDLVAFLAILVTARRRRVHRYPGIPHLLDVMLRDATIYFLLVFAFQVLLEFFVLFAPEEVQLVPGMVNTTLVPIMASRLMLSLKKAAAEPTVPWSLSTMSEVGKGTTQEHGVTRFTLHTFDVSRQISETFDLPNEGDIELESMPRSPRNRGSRPPSP